MLQFYLNYLPTFLHTVLEIHFRQIFKKKIKLSCQRYNTHLILQHFTILISAYCTPYLTQLLYGTCRKLETLCKNMYDDSNCNLRVIAICYCSDDENYTIRCNILSWFRIDKKQLLSYNSNHRIYCIVTYVQIFDR